MLKFVCKLIFVYRLLLFINGAELDLIYILRSVHWLICVCQLMREVRVLLFG